MPLVSQQQYMKLFLYGYSKSTLLFGIIMSFCTHLMDMFFHYGPTMYNMLSTRLTHLQHTALIWRIAPSVSIVAQKWLNMAI